MGMRNVLSNFEYRWFVDRTPQNKKLPIPQEFGTMVSR